jgi:hypothetical protein
LLRHRNYRLFLTGQAISLVGTWMQMLAVGWLVWRLTHSAFALGLVPFIGRLPTLLLTPFAGVQWTVIVGGASCMLGALAFSRRLPALREHMRPI